MKVKNFNEYQHLNEDEDENYQEGDDRFYVPDELKFWFQSIGVRKGRIQEALQELLDRGFVIVENPTEDNIG